MHKNTLLKMCLNVDVFQAVCFAQAVTYFLCIKESLLTIKAPGNHLHTLHRSGPSLISCRGQRLWPTSRFYTIKRGVNDMQPVFFWGGGFWCQELSLLRVPSQRVISIPSESPVKSTNHLEFSPGFVSKCPHRDLALGRFEDHRWRDA